MSSGFTVVAINTGVKDNSIFPMPNDRPTESVREVHQASRGSAGARSVANMVTAKGKPMGRWLAAKLMAERGLTGQSQNQTKFGAVM